MTVQVHSTALEKPRGEQLAHYARVWDTLFGKESIA